MHYLFIDTETTGLPKNYKASAEDVDNWPRIIQLAFAIYDEDHHLVETKTQLIKPDGWEIPTGAAGKFWEDNGFTMEKLEAKGVPIADAIHELIEHRYRAKFTVAHNLSFDSKIIRAEIIRLGLKPEFTGEKICTMIKSTKYCNLPQANGRAGVKWPKLEELHKVLFGKGFEGAHDAMNDVNACAACFFELKRLGVIL